MLSAKSARISPNAVRASDPRFETMDVTPQMATEWLDMNHNNRAVSQTRVDAFARVMKAGGWRVNNQAIAFDVDGNLIDGQHRLWAIVEAKMTVRISVAHNVSKDAIKTIDRGGTRSIGEVLRREGEMPSPGRVSSWCNSDRLLMENVSGKGSVEETEAYYARNRKAVDFLLAHLPSKPPFKPAMVGAAFIVAMRRHAALIENFVPAMVAGVNLEQTSPIYVAREIIISTAGDVKNQRRALALKILRCLQAEIRHEPMNKRHVYANESALHFFQSK